MPTKAGTSLQPQSSVGRPIDLSIIIVSWNVCDLLRRCLHSILRTASLSEHEQGTWRGQLVDGQPLSFEVIVVDSHSSDESVSMVRSEFPGVRLHASERNLGYTGGNNTGMQESRGRYVLLLNPDTKVVGEALSAMVSHLDHHPEVAVVGPQLLWPDGSVQSSRRRFPSLGTAVIESTFLQKWFPNHPVLQRYYTLDLPDDIPVEVDWVTGSCLLVRWSAIEQIGLLDDAFFMYSEELDWQKRMQHAGWKVLYLPAARVVHYEGKSSEQVVALTHIRFGRSKVLYFRKHHGRLASEAVRCWLLLNYAYEWTVEALKWCAGHSRALRRQRMHAYRQVLLSRFEI